jgi:integrase
VINAAGHLSAYSLRPEHFAPIIADWQTRWGIATVHTRRKYLAMLTAWLTASGANAQLRGCIPKTKAPQPRTVVAAPAELTALVENANPWMRCWLSLTAGHGLRFSEALRLCPADVDTSDQTMTYRTKGDRTNTLPMNDDLAPIAAAAQSPGNRLTPLIEIVAGRPITPKAVRDAWKALKKKAGANPWLRPHDLRRTLAVRLYESTKDMRAVQQTLGHKNLITTCIYLENRDNVNLRLLLNTLRSEQAAVAAAAAGRLTN